MRVYNLLTHSLVLAAITISGNIYATKASAATFGWSVDLTAPTDKDGNATSWSDLHLEFKTTPKKKPTINKLTTSSTQHFLPLPYTIDFIFKNNVLTGNKVSINWLSSSNIVAENTIKYYFTPQPDPKKPVYSDPIQPIPVPEPSALFSLLGLGGIGGVVSIRKKNVTKAVTT